MPDESRVDRERAYLLEAEQKGPGAAAGAYLRLSGPGLATSALSLGAGSMGSSLYLGILAGTSMLWIQPFAMLLGVIMLGAISYVTLSIGERPFRAINEHINPVLGWSWLAATLIANLVWALPQYSLSFAVIEQNLFPGLLRGDGWLGSGPGGGDAGKYVVSAIVMGICLAAAWSFGGGSIGKQIFDVLVKLVVAAIVLAFFGVVLRIAVSGEGIDWSSVFAGLVPSWRQFSEPAATFAPLLAAIENAQARHFWSELIVGQQRDVMLGAGSAAVGVNMTYMAPYIMLSRGWDRDFRRLAIFDLAVAMFIPFVLATGAVVIAAAHQFHTKAPPGFEFSEAGVVVPPRFEREFGAMLAQRDEALAGEASTPLAPAEQRLAAVLVRRDTSDLSQSLSQLFGSSSDSGGRFIANVVFGVGVLGMTLSSIALMMLISGLVVCDVLNRPPGSLAFRLGCMLPCIGALWPIFWQESVRAWLTVVASMFCVTLLPIAYVTFFALINQRSLMGNERPKGWRRFAANVLMAIAACSATAAAISAVIKSAGWNGLVVVGAYLALVLVVQFTRRRPGVTVAA